MHYNVYHIEDFLYAFSGDLCWLLAQSRPCSILYLLAEHKKTIYKSLDMTGHATVHVKRQFYVFSTRETRLVVEVQTTQCYYLAILVIEHVITISDKRVDQLNPSLRRKKIRIN